MYLISDVYEVDEYGCPWAVNFKKTAYGSELDAGGYSISDAYSLAALSCGVLPRMLM